MIKNMPKRPKELVNLLTVLQDFLSTQTIHHPQANQLATAIFTILKSSPGCINPLNLPLIQQQPQAYKPLNKRLPACRDFNTAIDNIRLAPAFTHPFADALLAIEPLLNWQHRSKANNLIGNENENIANTLLVGKNGLEQHDDVQIGMTIMSPNTLFTDHQHPPQEVYAVLSAGQWRQESNAWHEPGAGGFVYNPPSIIHSFQSNDAPLLAIWCLDSPTK